MQITLKNLLANLFFRPKNYKIQSFTYYIPSPPARNSGYREKHFDKLFFHFINKGYEILNFSTQACNGEGRSGMWLIFVVRATNSEADKLILDDEILDSLKASQNVKEQIDGLYYIDDRAEDNGI